MIENCGSGFANLPQEDCIDVIMTNGKCTGTPHEQEQLGATLATDTVPNPSCYPTIPIEHQFLE